VLRACPPFYLQKTHDVSLLRSLLTATPVTPTNILLLFQVSFFMPVEPWNVYREQLSSLYHGHALWEPDPVHVLYDKVSIGDVGYMKNGFFYRMFNVTREWGDDSNQKFGTRKPENYEPMKEADFKDIKESRLPKGDYYSPNVSREKNTDNKHARIPRE